MIVNCIDTMRDDNECTGENGQNIVAGTSRLQITDNISRC